MTMSQAARPIVLALTAVLVTASACAPLDEVLLPGGGAGGYGNLVQGEVRSLDARRGTMQVREDYNGRTVRVRFDNRTRVTNGSRQYPVSSLRRGDHVRVRVSHDRSGNAWADRIEVRSGYDDRGRVTGRTQRLSGRVASVDTRRNYFTLEQSRSRVVVHVPRRISSGDARRFERLRRGDRVNVEVRSYGRSEVELVRFR